MEHVINSIVNRSIEEAKVKPAKEEDKVAGKPGEKPSRLPNSPSEAEVPEQISLQQAQIQKELDELRKLQGNGKDNGAEQEGYQSEPSAHANQQLIAGIDTSLETVESYIEDIFS